MLLLTQSQSSAALRRIPFYMVNDIDGKTPVTGLTFSADDILVTKNGAAEANFTGTVTEVGDGLYYYTFTAAELNTMGFIVARFAKNNVRTFIATHQVTEINVNSLNSICDAILDRTNAIETFSLRNILKFMAAVLLGKVTGGPASPTFKAAGSTTTRVAAVADDSGNRTSVTLTE